ncbi:MAG TPA: nuclear transport factor 2 family protein [Myxococcales bacterium]|nr:nuclear transport factor 2 family protein [Myxococcales bacterium]HIK86324.1 nuclear transport factor 2 family protein [Myxococcales bacterium]
MDPRLQNILDRDAIHEVLVRYATSLDDRDWDRLASCFADDAVADYGTGVFEGPEAIVGLCRQMLEPLEVSQHLLGSFEITATGEVATSRCYFHAQHVRQGLAGGASLIVAGTYEDSLRSQAGKWLIQKRRLIVSWRDGNPKVLEP